MTSWDFWWFFCFCALSSIPYLIWMWNEGDKDRNKMTITGLIVVFLVLLLITIFTMGTTPGGRPQ